MSEDRYTHANIIKYVNCVCRVFCMTCNWVTHFVLSNIGEMLLFIWLWLCWNESYSLSFTHTHEDQYMYQHKQMWLNQLQQKSYYEKYSTKLWTVSSVKYKCISKCGDHSHALINPVINLTISINGRNSWLALEETHLSYKTDFVVCVYSYAGVPDALLAACISGHCSGVLQLLRAGSSGSPNDLLRYLVTHDHLVPPTNVLMVDMIELLLSLGITEPDLYRKVQNYFPETRKDIQIKADAAILGNYVC